MQGPIGTNYKSIKLPYSCVSRIVRCSWEVCTQGSRKANIRTQVIPIESFWSSECRQLVRNCFRNLIKYFVAWIFFVKEHAKQLCIYCEFSIYYVNYISYFVCRKSVHLYISNSEFLFDIFWFIIACFNSCEVELT